MASSRGGNGASEVYWALILVLGRPLPLLSSHRDRHVGSQRCFPVTGNGFIGPCNAGNGKSNKDCKGASPKAADQR